MGTRAYDISRYVAASLLLLYGFAKLTGAQFTVLESQLDKPLREVSGFWLTWYYFGYSAAYGTIVALVQVVGAIALMVPRTALIAACVLFLLVGNIILIDIFFGVDPGALFVAIVIEALLGYVLMQHKERLGQLFLPAQGRSRLSAHLLRVALVVGALGGTYYIANYNNRAPTEIDGKWTVVAGGPATVYFERNRAFLCVFKRPDGTTIDHHFEVDETRRTVRIWETWLSKGKLLYTGSYDRRRIELTGVKRLTLVRAGG